MEARDSLTHPMRREDSTTREHGGQINLV
jgi:hypothetical protein